MNKCNHEIVDENCGACMSKHYRSQIQIYIKTMIEIKGIASDLYADRGEDEKTANACNKIISLAGFGC